MEKQNMDKRLEPLEKALREDEKKRGHPRKIPAGCAGLSPVCGRPAGDHKGAGRGL